MEPSPQIFPLFDTPDTDILFEGQTWGWDGINRCAVVSQNQDEPSFKNVWSPQILSYIDIFLHCLPPKLLRIVLISSTSRAMKEAGIALFKFGYLLRYLVLWVLMST